MAFSSSLLSCNRKFSQLPAKASLRYRRQWGLIWQSPNAQLQGEFVSSYTKRAAPHVRGSATYTANWRSRIWIQLSLGLCLWSWLIEKNAWQTTVANWGGLSGVTRSLPVLKVLLATTLKGDRGFLSTPGLRGSFWRSCKVGLDRWCDKPGQTLWLRVIYRKQSQELGSY